MSDLQVCVTWPVFTVKFHKIQSGHFEQSSLLHEHSSSLRVSVYIFSRSTVQPYCGFFIFIFVLVTIDYEY